jgi:outer membrane protein OmpA-like peptidoglycan-associated protein
MRDNPSYRLLIEGFANPVTRSKNEPSELLSLATARAKEIENRFVRDGIARHRLIATGVGGIKNTDRGKTQQAKNRRVTMSIIRPDDGRLYRINFEDEWATVTGAALYAQQQSDSMQTIVAVASYIRDNPNSRVLIQGYETPAESRVKRTTPISRQRANEVVRLLRKEIALEGMRDFPFIISASANVEEPAVEILILDAPSAP